MKCGLYYLTLPHCSLSPSTQPGPGVYVVVSLFVVVVVFCCCCCFGGWVGGLVAVTSLVPSCVARAGCSVRILSPLSIKSHTG